MRLTIENLEKRFDARVAVEITSLVIPSGEFFAFVGPSGCGKTTTLNLIAGLEQPAGGSIYLGDRLVNNLPPHKRNVAFVFQSYALYPHRTVFENLAFPLEMAGIKRDARELRVREVAALLGIGSLLGKRPAQLSGGERQRVALGRAMVRQPHLFLFDEPLSNLDGPLRAQMRREIKRLHEQLGTTFIYVTHDQEEALSLADRIAVMRAGRIQQCAAPREIYDRPANQFVAGFFGSPPMNFLSVDLEASGGARWGVLGKLRAALPDSPDLNGLDSAVVGVRPEHVRLSRQPGDGFWPARVSLVELRGSQTYVEVDLEGVRVTALANEQDDYQSGQPVQVQLPAAHIHLFRTADGTRMANAPQPSH